MMDKEISKQLVEGMNILINQALDNYPADRTYFGIIQNKNSFNNTYTVMINGKDFENTKSFGEYNIGDRVYVLFPQNNPINRIILNPNLGGGGDKYEIISITNVGNHATEEYVLDSFAAITQDNKLIIVVEGGLSSTYPNIVFIDGSAPDNLVFQGQSTWNSNAISGGFYCAIYQIVSNNIKIRLNFDELNTTRSGVNVIVDIVKENEDFPPIPVG